MPSAHSRCAALNKFERQALSYLKVTKPGSISAVAQWLTELRAMAGTPSLAERARGYGRRVVEPQNNQVEFALDMVRAVLDGDAGPDDAQRLYLAYYDATIKRSGAQSPASHKVQVSKLRQIMKLAAEWPDDVEQLLKEVTDQHRRLTLYGGVKPLYAAMVDAAREQLKATKPLSVKQVIKVVAKEK